MTELQTAKTAPAAAPAKPALPQGTTPKGSGTLNAAKTAPAAAPAKAARPQRARGKGYGLLIKTKPILFVVATKKMKFGARAALGPSRFDAPSADFSHGMAQIEHFRDTTALPPPHFTPMPHESPLAWEKISPMHHAVELIRTRSEHDATLGQMRLDGRFFCYTLEPPATGCSHPCIHPGRYAIRLALSTRFHRQMIRLEDRDGRAGILIHAGNTAADTHGCILLGRSFSPPKGPDIPSSITDSAITCRNFYAAVVPWLNKKLTSCIVIKNVYGL